MSLDEYYLAHAVRGELLERLGRPAEAVAAYHAAALRTNNVAERNFLEQKQCRLEGEARR
ncbi:MAG: hypothetical protein ABIT38_15960 [Gemmatimonadaceae bacterium]